MRGGCIIPRRTQSFKEKSGKRKIENLDKFPGV